MITSKTLSSIDFTSVSISSDWNSDTISPIFLLSEDPVVLSCVLHRLRGEDKASPNGRCFSLSENHPELAKLISSEDRLMAQSIRLFYQGKIVLAKLREVPLSSFRNDLATLLLLEKNDRGTYPISEKYIGMVYKLPYFYEYDRSLIDTVFQNEYVSINGPTSVASANLRFICKLNSFRKRVSKHEYWFMDDKNNRVVLYLDINNPIQTLFENYITHTDTVRIKGLLYAKQKDNLTFYASNHMWNLVI